MTKNRYDKQNEKIKGLEYSFKSNAKRIKEVETDVVVNDASIIALRELIELLIEPRIKALEEKCLCERD